MVTGLATGPGGGGGYMLLVKNVPLLFTPMLPALILLTGLLTAPGWDCGRGGGGCVLCASWQTSVTKSEKVSWPFSWYLASVVGLCGPPLSTVEVVAMPPPAAEVVQTTGL